MARKAAPPVSACLLASHAFVREELSQLLAAAGIRVASRPDEGSDVPRAQVYVLDANGPRPLVEARVGKLLAAQPQAHVVVLAESFDEPAAFSYLRLGARGLLAYAESRAQLPRAVRAVAAGGYWVPRAWLSRFVETLLGSPGRPGRRAPAGLSRREQVVLDALLENLANKEIASRLNISERTVKFHVSNLLGKFGVRRRADLILQYYQSQPGSARAAR